MYFILSLSSRRRQTKLIILIITIIPSIFRLLLLKKWKVLKKKTLSNWIVFYLFFFFSTILQRQDNQGLAFRRKRPRRGVQRLAIARSPLLGAAGGRVSVLDVHGFLFAGRNHNHLEPQRNDIVLFDRCTMFVGLDVSRISALASMSEVDWRK